MTCFIFRAKTSWDYDVQIVAVRDGSHFSLQSYDNDDAPSLGVDVSVMYAGDHLHLEVARSRSLSGALRNLLKDGFVLSQELVDSANAIEKMLS